MPYNYSGSGEDYITVSIQDPSGTTIFEKVQWWDGASGGGTRSGTIFPLSCIYQLTGSPSKDRTIILIIKNKGSDLLRLFSKRTNDSLGDVSPLPYLSIKISEYQAL